MTFGGSDDFRFEWHDYDLNALRDLCGHAVKKREDGDIENVRIKFLKALNDFESLVESSHYASIYALFSFVQFCLFHDFYDEAEDKMKKFLTNHQIELDDNHEQILQSVANLDHFFFLRKKDESSEILLTKAKIGFYNLYKSNAKSVLLNTLKISENLIEIYRRHDEFTKIEQKLFHMIEMNQAAKNLHESKIIFYKHDLVHLY